MWVGHPQLEVDLGHFSKTLTGVLTIFSARFLTSFVGLISTSENTTCTSIGKRELTEQQITPDIIFFVFETELD